MLCHVHNHVGNVVRLVCLLILKMFKSVHNHTLTVLLLRKLYTLRYNVAHNVHFTTHSILPFLVWRTILLDLASLSLLPRLTIYLLQTSHCS